MADLTQKQLFTLNNSIYLLTNNPIPWGEAQQEAQTFSGNLVTIETSQEQTFLAGLFAGKELWIGYNDSGVEGTFTWIGGEQSAYTNWENGQPDNGFNSEDFAFLTANNGSWNDGNGTSNRQGIIEITNPTTPIILVEDLGIIEPSSGSQEVSFQVRLFGTTTQPVTVNYTTVDGSAKQGIEYTTTSGTITFQPGEQLKTVPVIINADADTISNEKFTLSLSSPTNAILGDNTATATIKELTEFFSFKGKTYLLSQAGNWGSAEVEATTFGGHLATIETPEEQAFLAGAYAGQNVWIGLSDAGGENTFSWIGGEQSAYTNWENEQPNNGFNSEDFAFLTDNNGSWNDGDGSSSLQGIIEITSPLNLPIPDFTKKQFFILDDSLYFLTDVNGKWGQAQQEAQNFGGNLVTIATPQEQTFLAGLFAGKNLWIGYNDAGREDAFTTEDTFSWISGEQSAYTNWENEQPNNGFNSEDFAFLTDNNGSWNDGDGSSNFQGVVEINNPTTPIILVEDLGIIEPSSGSHEVSFQVRLFGSSTQPITVNYTTIDDSAKQGIEYTATSGTITFQPGEKLKTVTVRVNADVDTTNNEKFSLSLSSPTNAILGDSTAIATIKERSEFVSFGGKTYLLSQEGNWGTTEAEAKTFGGHLATIETPEEQAFLAGKYAGKNVWIGLSDAGGENSFNWVSGEQSAYINWEGGQPNNGANIEDFAFLTANNGSWNDGDGSSSFQGIIEFPGTLQDTPTDPTNPNLPILDIDGSGGQPSFARDGLLLSALLFFYKDDRTDYSILNKFILDDNANRKTGDEIANNLKDKISNFDADGNGQVTFARDGLLISAFLFFYKVDRTDYSILDKFIFDANATRKNGNEVADYLKTLIIPNSSTAPIYSDNNGMMPKARGYAPEPSEIIGTIENDLLTGDANNNIIVGDRGDDLLTGGLGRDTFVFGLDSGKDAIVGFSVDVDLIQVDSALAFGTVNDLISAITFQGMIDGKLSSELDLGSGNTLTILSDRELTLENFVSQQF